MDAVVPTGTSPYPLVASGSAAANSLVVGAGARLTQGGGTLDVKGSVDNSGTISATAGTVRLSGTTAQAIGGSGSTQFWGLAVANPAGASQAGEVSVHGALALASGSLTTNGKRADAALRRGRHGPGGQHRRHGERPGHRAALHRPDLQRAVGLPPLQFAGGQRHASTTWPRRASRRFSTKLITPAGQRGDALPQRVRLRPGPRGKFCRHDCRPLIRAFWCPRAPTRWACMSGYTVNIGADQVVDLQGALTNGPVSRTGLLRGSQLQSGWQFLGNPYPSPIDFSQTSRRGADQRGRCRIRVLQHRPVRRPVPQLRARLWRPERGVHAGLLRPGQHWPNHGQLCPEQRRAGDDDGHRHRLQPGHGRHAPAGAAALARQQPGPHRRNMPCTLSRALRPASTPASTHSSCPTPRG
ncbi:MAG: hypothetical protein WKG07_20270 [Hymenobacter sp.]